MSSFVATETATHTDTHTPIGLKLMVCCGLDQSQRELRKSPSPSSHEYTKCSCHFCIKYPWCFCYHCTHAIKEIPAKILRPVYVKMSVQHTLKSHSHIFHPHNSLHGPKVKVLTSSSFFHDMTMLAHLNVPILAFPLRISSSLLVLDSMAHFWQEEGISPTVTSTQPFSHRATTCLHNLSQWKLMSITTSWKPQDFVLR